MNFLMSSTFTHYSNASYNQTILQKDAHISMGVENTYDLALNSSPYLIGAITTYGDSTNNSLNIKAGSSVESFLLPCLKKIKMVIIPLMKESLTL